MTVSTFYPNADVRVRRDMPDANYGNSYWLSVGNINVSGVEYEHYSYLNFPISGIPSNAIISSAVLTLYQDNSTSTDSGLCRIYFDRCTSSWSEAMTWRTGQPSVTTSGRVTWDYSSNTVGLKSNINITGIAQAWINSGASNYGIRMAFYDNPTYYDNLKYFCAYETDMGSAYRPYLTITWSLPPTAPPLQVNIGDAWRTTSNVYINVSDIWREVSNAYVNIGDVWREIT